jgi:type IV pilus biogenesis protein CpaD/CtpE
MNAKPSDVARRTVAAGLRMLVLATAASVLAGCYAAREAQLEVIPNDYRQRHPIVLKEAPRTVELSSATGAAP